MDTRNTRVLIILLIMSLLSLAHLKAAHALPSGTWSQTENMIIPRSKHTATLLPDGTVLVAGGLTGSLGNTTTTSSAEVYNPVTGKWSVTSSMIVARSRFTATLLQNGKVLVAGGSNNGIATAIAELYDFKTGLWMQTGNMKVPRFFHTATLLMDGRVLATGGLSAGDGNDNFVEKTAEIYNPNTETWTLIDNMSNARYGHTSTVLQNGTVLVVGGAGPRGDLVYTVRAEIFDPHSGLWKNADSLITPRGFHTAILLNSGNMLVAGGLTLPANSPNRTITTELFRTSSSKWISTTSMAVAHSAGAYGGALLPDGRFFIAGGRTDTAEVYSPNTGTWELLSNMAVSRSFHTVTLLTNGTILVSGGENANGFIGTTEIYSP